MRTALRLSARQVSVLFTIVAIILWSYSICRAQLDIGLYGIISSFPITFFIGLAFLTVASAILWVSPRNEGKLLLLQTCLFLIMLWLTPVLIAPTVECYRGGALGHFIHTDYLLQTGHLDPLVASYHNWPGASIISAAFVDIFGWHHADSLLPVIAVTPLVASFLSLPLLYIFLKNMLGEGRSNYCWAGVWLFNIGSTVSMLTFSPHGFGFLLFLAILALISTDLAWERGVAAFGHRLGTILTFAALVITHVFSSFVGLIAVMASYATKKLKTSTLVILAAVFIVSWTIYGTAAFFEADLPAFVSEMFRLDRLWTAGVGGRFVGSQAHQNVVLLRIVLPAMFFAIGIAGAILSRKVKWDNDKTALAMVVGFLVFTGVMGMGYGGELPGRMFLFLLPIIAYFSMKLLYRRATAFALFAVLLLALPLHFLCMYGNLYTEYRSPAFFTGARFFFDHTTEGHIISDYGSEQFRELRYTSYHRHGFIAINWEEDSIYHPGKLLRPPSYIVIANDEKYYDYIFDDPEYFAQIDDSLNSATNCHRIYANPDIQLYTLIPPIRL